MKTAMHWLLETPSEEERRRMEQAENFTFTSDAPAPRLDPSQRATGGSSCQSVLVNMFSVEATELLAHAGMRPAVLNFAHGYNCGGGFEHAGGSQEEDIFRKTSVVMSLWPHRRIDDGPGVLKRGMWIGGFDDLLPRKDPYYPHTECGSIYSPHVRAVGNMDGEVNSMPLFSVLTVAAQNVSWEPPFNEKLLREKIRTVLYMAAARGHDSVVLGAFGCGYFYNPPEVVAKAFRQILDPEKGEFGKAFRLAVFAVPRFGSKDSNVRAFAHHFPEVSQQALLVAAQKMVTASGSRAAADAGDEESAQAIAVEEETADPSARPGDARTLGQVTAHEGAASAGAGGTEEEGAPASQPKMEKKEVPPWLRS